MSVVFVPIHSWFVQRARRLWSWLLVGCWFAGSLTYTDDPSLLGPSSNFQAFRNSCYSISVDLYVSVCSSIQFSTHTTNPVQWNLLFNYLWVPHIDFRNSPSTELFTGLHNWIKTVLVLSVSDMLLQLGMDLAHITARKHWDSTSFVPRTFPLQSTYCCL